LSGYAIGAQAVLMASRIKAAGAAIAYERPKLSVQLRVGPAVLGERLDQAKAVKTIEHQP
jgi:hypothetical protein